MAIDRICLKCGRTLFGMKRKRNRCYICGGITQKNKPPYRPEEKRTYGKQ